MSKYEDNLEAALAEHGLALDAGNVIGGPFIPDGIYRIYRPGDLGIVGSGSTLEAAIDDLPLDTSRAIAAQLDGRAW